MPLQFRIRARSIRGLRYFIVVSSFDGRTWSRGDCPYFATRGAAERRAAQLAKAAGVDK